MRVLVINSGSSSIKFQIIDVFEGEPGPNLTHGPILLRGSVKSIGGTGTLERVAEGKFLKTISRPTPNHHVAIQWIFDQLEQHNNKMEHTVIRWNIPYRYLMWKP